MGRAGPVKRSFHPLVKHVLSSAAWREFITSVADISLPALSSPWMQMSQQNKYFEIDDRAFLKLEEHASSTVCLQVDETLLSVPLWFDALRT